MKHSGWISRAAVVAVAVSAVLVATTAGAAPLSSPSVLPSQQATAPSLGTAASFAILGGQTVTNTGPTTVSGDLGVSPLSAVTGFPPGSVNGGAIHAADAVALQAQSDVTDAYDDLAGQPCGVDLTGQDLGGMTLTPDVYCFTSSAQLTGTLTLDAVGDPDSVFVFQIGSTLTTAEDSSVRVINGNNVCNLFWQVGSSAVLGTDTRFAGNILALTSITLNTRTRVSGRGLARNAAVTMDNNRISSTSCASASGGGSDNSDDNDDTSPPTATSVPPPPTSPPVAAVAQPTTTAVSPADAASTPTAGAPADAASTPTAGAPADAASTPGEGAAAISTATLPAELESTPGAIPTTTLASTPGATPTEVTVPAQVPTGRTVPAQIPTGLPNTGDSPPGPACPRCSWERCC